MLKTKPLWLLLLVCLLTVIPFLGIYDYNTKGEPRESIVSYTMLESGNWILPRNSVNEIAYKPPMLYWAVATVSWVAGQINEFTSRLPSAIAYIALIIAVYLFYSKRRDRQTAFVTAIVAFTSWELHRQGFNCRVDMLLTVFIVGALLLFYRWYERGMRGIPLWAILLMSCGTLTKGPVGILIPCLVMGIFLLCRRVHFFRAFLTMLLCGVLSLMLPALWYFLAWQQGGQEFIDLVMEENVGRMTGNMSYSSHAAPWYYNIFTIVVGYLPWVLTGLLTLFVVRWKSLSARRILRSIRRRWTGLGALDPVDLFSAVAILVIFVFYCIPESKRSVYLMPIYPFIAYFATRLLFWLQNHHPRIIRIYGGFLSLTCLMAVVLFIAMKWIDISPDWFHGRHGYDNYTMLTHLQQADSWWQWLILAFATYILLAWWKGKRTIMGLVMLILAFYLQFDSVYKPAVLNAKSVKSVAEEVDRVAPERDGRMYEFIEDGVLSKGDPVHFFEMNFYMHDRVGDFYKEKPAHGFLMIGTDDASRWLPRFEADGYHFTWIYHSGEKRVGNQPLCVVRFTR